MQNPCMGSDHSCSACCGIFNLRKSDTERREWLRENTRLFLSTDIGRAENIVAFRREREAVTLNHRVRDDIYVCPFLGFIDADEKKTGCLLHPAGSPHPQIHLWEHPQNFSFYGEGICLSYDCLAKERRFYLPQFFEWSKKASSFAYSRLACDYALHAAMAQIFSTKDNLVPFYNAVALLYERLNAPMTSFEDVPKDLPKTREELCSALAARFAPNETETVFNELMVVPP